MVSSTWCGRREPGSGRTLVQVPARLQGSRGDWVTLKCGQLQHRHQEMRRRRNVRPLQRLRRPDFHGYWGRSHSKCRDHRECRAFGDRFIARLLALVCSLGVLAAAMTVARAGPYEDALLHFHRRQLRRHDRGHQRGRTSGNPLAATVFGALQEGRLVVQRAAKRVSSGTNPASSSTPQRHTGDRKPTRICRRCGSISLRGSSWQRWAA